MRKYGEQERDKHGTFMIDDDGIHNEFDNFGKGKHVDGTEIRKKNLENALKRIRCRVWLACKFCMRKIDCVSVACGVGGRRRRRGRGRGWFDDDLALSVGPFGFKTSWPFLRVSPRT